MGMAAILDQLDAESQYLPDGVGKAYEFVRKHVAFYEPSTADNLTVTRIGDLTNVAQAVDAGAGHVYALIILSPTAAVADCSVQVFNVAFGSVTVGTTAPTDVFRCPAGKARAVLFSPGHDHDDLYDTGISVAATTTHDGGTALAAASLPDIIVISA